MIENRNTEEFQYVDMENWPRREVYDSYAKISCPYYVVAFNIDVTNVYDYAKEKGISFYLALVFLCTETVNEIPAFLYGIHEGRVVRIPGRDALFTDLRRGEEQFHCSMMPRGGEMISTCREAKAESLAQTTFMPEQVPEFHIIYSCLPWLEITAITNEHEMKSEDCGEDTNLLIEWGKFREENGRKFLNMSIDVNHRFIDGITIGRFAMGLEKKIHEICAATGARERKLTE